MNTQSGAWVARARLHALLGRPMPTKTTSPFRRRRAAATAITSSCVKVAVLIIRTGYACASGPRRRRTRGQMQTATPAESAWPPTASQAMPRPHVLKSALTSGASCREDVLLHPAGEAVPVGRDLVPLD